MATPVDSQDEGDLFDISMAGEIVRLLLPVGVLSCAFLAYMTVLCCHYNLPGDC